MSEIDYEVYEVFPEEDGKSEYYASSTDLDQAKYYASQLHHYRIEKVTSTREIIDQTT